MSEATLTKPSLTLRIGLGKVFGLAIGLVGFLLLPFFAPETSMMFRWRLDELGSNDACI